MFVFLNPHLLLVGYRL